MTILTDVVFNDTEIQLLNEGLKYNLHHEKNWIQTIAIEAHTAISQLPEKDQMNMGQLSFQLLFQAIQGPGLLFSSVIIFHRR
jgi:hypothetical protein